MKPLSRSRKKNTPQPKEDRLPVRTESLSSPRTSGKVLAFGITPDGAASDPGRLSARCARHRVDAGWRGGVPSTWKAPCPIVSPPIPARLDATIGCPPAAMRLGAWRHNAPRACARWPNEQAASGRPTPGTLHRGTSRPRGRAGQSGEMVRRRQPGLHRKISLTALPEESDTTIDWVAPVR